MHTLCRSIATQLLEGGTDTSKFASALPYNAPRQKCRSDC